MAPTGLDSSLSIHHRTTTIKSLDFSRISDHTILLALSRMQGRIGIGNRIDSAPLIPTHPKKETILPRGLAKCRRRKWLQAPHLQMMVRILHLRKKRAMWM